MADRKRTQDDDIREAFGENIQIQRAPGVLSEDEIRAIVREELAAAMQALTVAKAAQNTTWRHDADHGSIQARRVAQRQRDVDAGLNAAE